MSTPLENLEQQYAAEVVKVDADEGLLKRLERGIRGLKGVAESIGQCSVRYLSGYDDGPSLATLSVVLIPSMA